MATFQKRGERVRAIVRTHGVSKSKSFSTLTAAKAWAKRVESEAETDFASGVIRSSKTVRDLIDWYMKEVKPTARWRRSKESALMRLRGLPWTERIATSIKPADLIEFAGIRRDQGAGPATINQDIMYLRVVLKAGRTIGVGVDLRAVEDAATDLRQRKAIGKGGRRNRRPSDDELTKLREYFRTHHVHIPMNDIIDFAIATTRRQDEIVRLQRDDLDRAKGIWLLRDVKDPRKREGNHKPFRILPAAVAIVDRQPVNGVFAFNASGKYVSKLFTNACADLRIIDLTFHDLRHHAISLLFEAGYSIQEVAMFSLHETWATLQRYTHLRPEDIVER